MTLDGLRLLRGILLRSVLIGAALTLGMQAVTFGAWDWWTAIVLKLCHVDEPALGQLVIRFFMDIKFFVLFFLLTPGLAIHWTIRKEESSRGK